MDPPSDDILGDLREALAHSPDNVPLRNQVGTMLLRRGFIDEAEAIFRDGLGHAPASEAMRLGLARCHFQQGKNSSALVIVEELTARGDAGADALLLLARLHLRDGAIDRGRLAYRRAVDADARCADEDLDEVFGVTRTPEPADGFEPDGFAQHEVDDEGRMLLAHESDEPDEALTELERPGIDFSDVGGMEELKDEIRMKIIHPMRHPELYEAYGKAAGGGVLLFGPPGCGKTWLARATAGEIDAGFITVGINDVLDMYIGRSEQRLHAIFEQARRAAPCVLFFDEVDALGASRRDMRHSAGRHLINQFLAELDGAQHSNDGVLVLGATNAPWHLDAAFRRPGRFDRIVFVPPPDATGRAAILRVLLKGKPVDEIDHEAIARRTEKFSGADLKAVVDQAIEAKLRDAMKDTSDSPPAPLRTRDLTTAVKRVKPSTREWFSTARNHALYANQSGAYDDILKHLGLS